MGRTLDHEELIRRVKNLRQSENKEEQFATHRPGRSRSAAWQKYLI